MHIIADRPTLPRRRHHLALKASSLTILALLTGACSSELGDSSPMGDAVSPGAGSAAGTIPGAVGGGAQTPGAGTTGAVGGVPSQTGGVDPTAPGGTAGAVGGTPTTGDTPGTSQDPTSPGAIVDTTQLQPFEPPEGMLRRLTRTQFRNSVRDIFGSEVSTEDLDGDSWDGDFAVIGASSVVTSARGVEQYQAAIESAVSEVFADPTRRADFIGCELSDAGDAACVRNFVETMGRRAWRRPLTTEEADRIVGIADNATTELGSAIEGVRWATMALFTSPNFIYRPELGVATADGSMRLTGYELASRLAFVIWNSTPDDALLDEAAAGMLDTTEGVRTAAQRMLETPAGREAVGAFAEEYMRLDRIGTQAKDAGLFPEYGPELQAAMVRDMREVWQVVAFDEQANTLDLFKTTKVVVNSDLAQLYGIDAAGLDSNTFEERTLPADSPRVGILAKAGFLSQFANQQEGSPTLRGKFMRQALMCTLVPPPPANAEAILADPPVGVAMTKRERLELHREDPTCAACHALMDPLGLPFESFDAIGRYRTTEEGLPIDPTSEFDGIPVADSRELGATLATSTTVANCLVRRYYSYAVGHAERNTDASVIQTLDAAFSASGYKFRDLILDVITHEAFAAVAPQEG